MCYADVYPNDDGTFSVFCYCGHCEHGFVTRSAADEAAREHQESQDDQIRADNDDEALSRAAEQN